MKSKAYNDSLTKNNSCFQKFYSMWVLTLYIIAKKSYGNIWVVVVQGIFFSYYNSLFWIFLQPLVSLGILRYKNCYISQVKVARREIERERERGRERERERDRESERERERKSKSFDQVKLTEIIQWPCQFLATGFCVIMSLCVFDFVCDYVCVLVHVYVCHCVFNLLKKSNVLAFQNKYSMVYIECSNLSKYVF